MQGSLDEWKEVVQHTRHWESLLFENARTMIGVVTGTAAGAGAVLVTDVDPWLRAVLVPLLCGAAALLAWAARRQIRSTQSYLRRFYDRRKEIELLTGLSLRLPSEDPHRGDAVKSLCNGFHIAALGLFALACVALVVLMPGHDAERPPDDVTGAVRDVAQGIGRVADALAHPPATATGAAVPSAESGASRPVSFAGQASAEAPAWWISVSIAGLVLSSIGLVSVLLGRATPATVKVAVASTSIATLVGSAASLGFQGKLTLKGEFNCGPAGCLRIERSAAGSSLRLLGRSPSFGIGSAAPGDPAARCAGPDNSARAWEDWVAHLAGEWKARMSASPDDVVVISGSADRQRLSPALRERHESNSGLAAARAEAVRAKLMAALAAEVPRDRLDEDRVLLVAAGPAGTGAALRHSGGQLGSCEDRALSEDRRVSVWIQAAGR